MCPSKFSRWKGLRETLSRDMSCLTALAGAPPGRWGAARRRGRREHSCPSQIENGVCCGLTNQFHIVFPNVTIMNLNWLSRSSPKASRSKTSCSNSSRSIYAELPLKPQRKGNEIVIVALGGGQSELEDPKSVFQKIPGVERVVVGYTGGQHGNPTSESLHDHVEALFVEFNPKIKSLSDLFAEDLIAYISKFNRPTIFATSRFQHGQILRVIRYQTQYEYLSSPTLFSNGLNVDYAGRFYQAESAQEELDKQRKRNDRRSQKHVTAIIQNFISPNITPIISPPNAPPMTEPEPEKRNTSERLSLRTQRQNTHAAMILSPDSAMAESALTEDSSSRTFGESESPGSAIPINRKYHEQQDECCFNGQQRPKQQQQHQQKLASPFQLIKYRKRSGVAGGNDFRQSQLHSQLPFHPNSQLPFNCSEGHCRSDQNVPDRCQLMDMARSLESDDAICDPFD